MAKKKKPVEAEVQDVDVRIKTRRTKDQSKFTVEVTREDGGAIRGQMVVTALERLLPNFRAIARAEYIASGIAVVPVGEARDA